MGYAAMSIPAGFKTYAVSDADAQRLLDKAHGRRRAGIAGRARGLGRLCHQPHLPTPAANTSKPFHLMIGVNRDVYAQGVPIGHGPVRLGQLDARL